MQAFRMTCGACTVGELHQNFHTTSKVIPEEMNRLHCQNPSRSDSNHHVWTVGCASVVVQMHVQHLHGIQCNVTGARRVNAPTLAPAST